MNTSMEQEVQVLKDSAAAIQADFDKPDDDWQGMAVFITEEGDGALFPLIFRDDDEKQFIATVAIPLVIREVKPWFVGQVQSAWTVSLPRDPGLTATETIETYQELGISRPSMHPDREECLILVACTVDQVQFWQAKINRFSDKPPALGEWVLWPTHGSAGMFIDPIVATLKEIQG